jgi:hypothetical protein
MKTLCTFLNLYQAKVTVVVGTEDIIFNASYARIDITMDTIFKWKIAAIKTCFRSRIKVHASVAGSALLG